MPRAPISHGHNKIGRSHSDDLKRLRSNALARQRQKRRMYATSSKQWIKLRNYKRKLNPLCEECERKGIVTPMTDVDHIDGDTFNNELINLQSLCKSCHSKKTARENQLGRYER